MRNIISEEEFQILYLRTIWKTIEKKPIAFNLSVFSPKLEILLKSYNAFFHIIILLNLESQTNEAGSRIENLTSGHNLGLFSV